MVTMQRAPVPRSAPSAQSCVAPRSAARGSLPPFAIRFGRTNIVSMEWKLAVHDHAGTDLASLFSDLVRLETELWDLVDGRLRREHDLALSWFEPMQVIDRTAGCRVVDIADELSITIGGTSKLVDRIEAAGWCERSPNPDDGRSSVVGLTGSGRRLLTAARHTFDDEIGLRLGAGLSSAERRRFAATVAGLRRQLQDQPVGSRQ